MKWIRGLSWTTRVLLLLAVAVLAQVGIAHAVALQAADYTGHGWLYGAHVRQVPDVLSSELSRGRAVLRPVVELPRFHAAVRAAEESVVRSTLDDALGSEGRWWLLDEAGEVLATSAPGCVAPLLGLEEQGEPSVGICGEDAFVFGVLAGVDQPWSVIYGVRLGERFVARVRRVSGLEALLRVRGDARFGTFASEGGTSIDLRQLQLPTNDDITSFEEVEIMLPGYVGYRDEQSGAVYYAAEGPSSWYFGRQALDHAHQVHVELFAPVQTIRLGPNYALVVLLFGSIVTLGIVGALVRRTIARFRGPLVALSRSANHVASGEFSHAVPVPQRHELTEFCKIYNAMLGRLAELVQTRSDLAHAAGMAEIAVGVLHNIGNAITTVNVGVQVARAGLDEVSVERFERLADLVEEHRDDLASFFAPGAKGAVIPRFLRGAAASLRTNLDAVGSELGTVAVATEHTMEIVRAQQRYAGVACLTSHCSVESVVEDAVRISDVERRGRVVRQYDRVHAEVDRHRLIQIVVNLLTNAAEALVDCDDGCIWVSIVGDTDEYRVRVADNGPGIALDALHEVFRAGYTTKPGGHGLGLHNSFHAAVEMGGTLNLERPANGPGVAFELVLPGKAARRKAAAV